MIKPVNIFVFCALLLALAGCRPQTLEQRSEFLVFGTLVEVVLWEADSERGRQAFSSLHERFQAMHRDWHAWEPGLLVTVNMAFAEGRGVEASPDIVAMIEQSRQIETLSEGCFNPAIGGLISLWGFHTSEFPIEGPPPGRDAIEELLSGRPSSRDIHVDGLQLSSKNPSVQLDFGGIAKGYAIDLAMDILRDLGVENAIVNAGGDLRTIGGHGDRPWRIAVRKPGGGIIGAIETGPDEAIFTSGNYERFVQHADRRYPHILDPRTGWPVQDVASVTVIADEGALADAAATALTVAGHAEWPSVAAALGLSTVMRIDEDGKAWLTPEMDQRVEFVGEIEKEVVVLPDY
jgi:thiamine biosynthesis lipoprotein